MIEFKSGQNLFHCILHVPGQSVLDFTNDFIRSSYFQYSFDFEFFNLFFVFNKVGNNQSE